MTFFARLVGDIRGQMQARSLTTGEINLAHSVFGAKIDYSDVAICHSKWIFFQPRTTVMAPLGNIHFHPESRSYCEDFALAPPGLQGLFIHEMTHIWQHQSGIFLPLMRHPFCRYNYVLRPDRPFERYGLEQQAEIVRHAFLQKNGIRPKDAPDLAQLAALAPFPILPGTDQDQRYV